MCSDIFINKGEQLNKHSNVVQFDTNINSSKNLEAFSDMNNLSHIVIFVVGGATYTEYNKIVKNFDGMGKDVQVVFGSTEMINAQNFLRQLSSL